MSIINGTGVAETLVGGAANDTINGLGENDVLIGLGGHDLMQGGAGQDTIHSDALDGPDTLNGGSDSDLAVVSRQYHTGNLTLNLSNPPAAQNLGDGTVIVNVEWVLFVSGAGHDTLGGGDLWDRILGGMGNDLLRGGAGRDTLDGGTGNDTLAGNQHDDLMNGGVGDDSLAGGLGNDALDGSSGENTLSGGAGGDHIVSSVYSTGDVIDGGAGIDQANIYRTGSASLQGVNISIANPSAKQTLPDGTTIVNIEALVFEGGIYGDTVTGGDLWDKLYGRDGDDSLSGNAGDDVLYGGELAGNDTLKGGNGYDWLDGGQGTDMLLAGAGNDTILSDGVATIDGGIGIDEARISRAGFDGDLSLDLSGSSPVEVLEDGTVIAGVERIVFRGGSGDDTLTGGARADRLDGYYGKDVLNGGAGNDTLLSDDPDVLDGGAGVDLAEIDRGGTATALTLNLANPANAQILADGTTIVNVERARVHGSNGGDRLTGGAYADEFWGYQGADTLSGGGGSDWLAGGLGPDRMTGGSGADTFYFNTLDGSMDVLTDFASVDMIGIVGSVFGGGLTAGMDLAAEGRFVASATPVATGNTGTFLYDTDTGLLRFDADGTGAGAAIAVAHLIGAPLLTAGDFDIV